MDAKIKNNQLVKFSAFVSIICRVNRSIRS